MRVYGVGNRNLKAIALLPEDRFHIALRGLGMRDRQDAITLRGRLGLMTAPERCACMRSLNPSQLNPMFRFGEQPTMFGLGQTFEMQTTLPQTYRPRVWHTKPSMGLGNVNPKQLLPTYIGTDEESADFFSEDASIYKMNVREGGQSAPVADARPVQRKHLVFMRIQNLTDREQRLTGNIARLKVKLARLQKRKEQLERFSSTRTGEAASAFLGREMGRTSAAISNIQDKLPRMEDNLRAIKERKAQLESKSNGLTKFKGMAYISEGFAPLLKEQVRFVNGSAVYRPAYDSYPLSI